jgi:uncharacterized protein YndB with AHSA1/START domain
MTMADGYVSVSRRIEVPAERLFALLANPANHPLIDGSGMVRDPVAAVTLSGTGDTFRMNMQHDEWGDYQMDNEVVEYQAGQLLVWQPARVEVSGPEQQEVIRSAWYRWGFEFVPDGPDATMVTETFDCSRSPEQLRDAVQEGEGWRDAMTASLVKLELLANTVGPA